MKLLHIDSSISGTNSVSRQLSASIVSRLKQATPGLHITYRDLDFAPVPHHSQALQNLRIQAQSASATADAGVVPIRATDVSNAGDTQLQRDFATINAALKEFVAADIVVVGTPMYNFGIPSQLKSWIDSLAVAGQTFRYSATGVEGLCGGKRIIVASSRGGIYTAPSPIAAFDHQEKYLSAFFGFIGVKDIEFVRAEGVALGAKQRQLAIDSALAEVVMLKAA